MWFIAAAGCAGAFALYTRHAWEDWYITFRSSKNLALGNGLVYNVGERVHTFTSVLGTLLPAFLSFVTGNVSDDLVLWLFRAVNCVVLGASAVLLLKAVARQIAYAPSIALLLGVFVVDTKTIDFSINGMETAYVVLALSLFFYLVSEFPPGALRWKLGCTWALLEYARPDGVVYIALLSVALVIFGADRREWLKICVLSAGIAAALFAPWCIFALGYYGSPVPHSIVAKGALMSYHFGDIAHRTWAFGRALALLRPTVLDDVFAPPYSVLFDQPVLIKIGRVFAYFAGLVWLVPAVKTPGRVASFGFAGFMVYLAAVTPFIYPWYIPGATLLALLSLAYGIDAVLARVERARAREVAMPAGWAFGAALIALMLTFTVLSAHQFRRMEAINERGNREQIGRWLKANAKSANETVFVECAGYIGFYSGLTLYDFPGMTSHDMVQARKILGTDDWLSLIKYLAPDWLVLRPAEFQRMWAQESGFFQTHYLRAAEFDVSEKIQRVRFRPYEDYWRMDADFLVFRRRSE